MDKLIEEVRGFREEREWDQFHTPENLAKSISIEAGELLEHFQWNNQYNLTDVSEEVADVFIYCIHMADALGVDLIEIAKDKMIKNKLKYPVNKSRGSSKKYTELD